KEDRDVPVRHTQQVANPDIVQELFREDEFVVYCAASHRLAKRRSITWNDLAEERGAVTAAIAFGPLLSLRSAFEERGLPGPRIALLSDLVMFKLRAVAG